MNLLSIQSHVAYGHVGNAAAVFPLQRIGVEVWPVHTVQFAAHTGYGPPKGRAFDAAMIADVIAGIAERGAFARCDGVLSGYIGSPEIGAAILDAVAAVKAANPKARYCCDPVIGDVGRGIYVRDGVEAFICDQAVRAADIVTPNQFELEYIAGRHANETRDILAAIDEVHRLGPATVLLTSLDNDDTPPGSIDLVVSDKAGRFLLRTPQLPALVNGAGDAIAALFFAHYLATGSAAEALARAASSVYGVIKRTVAAQSRELLLVEAQEEFVNPTTVFQSQKL